MLISRLTPKTLYFLLLIMLTPYLHCHELEVTVCVDKFSGVPQKNNINILKTPQLSTKPYVLATPTAKKKIRKLSLNSNWCKKNYVCYSLKLDEKRLRKKTSILTAVPYNVRMAIGNPSYKLPSENQLLSFQGPFMEEVGQNWRYNEIATVSIKKINSQRFDVSFQNFIHPFSPIDFDIKVRTQKWAVVDNKYGSALIRIDRSLN